MKKIGIRILGCMALLSMVGCGRIEGASVNCPLCQGHFELV